MFSDDVPFFLQMVFAFLMGVGLRRIIDAIAGGIVSGLGRRRS